MGKIRGAIVVDEARCKGCSLCVAACPQSVIELSPKKVNVNGYSYAVPVDMDGCTGCAACAQVCPDACITVYRKKTED